MSAPCFVHNGHTFWHSPIEIPNTVNLSPDDINLYLNLLVHLNDGRLSSIIAWNRAAFQRIVASDIYTVRIEDSLRKEISQTEKMGYLTRVLDSKQWMHLSAYYLEETQMNMENIDLINFRIRDTCIWTFCHPTDPVYVHMHHPLMMASKLLADVKETMEGETPDIELPDYIYPNALRSLVKIADRKYRSTLTDDEAKAAVDALYWLNPPQEYIDDLLQSMLVKPYDLSQTTVRDALEHAFSSRGPIIDGKINLDVETRETKAAVVYQVLKTDIHVLEYRNKLYYPISIFKKFY